MASKMVLKNSSIFRSYEYGIINVENLLGTEGLDLDLDNILIKGVKPRKCIIEKNCSQIEKLDGVEYGLGGIGLANMGINWLEQGLNKDCQATKNCDYKETTPMRNKAEKLWVIDAQALGVLAYNSYVDIKNSYVKESRLGVIGYKLEALKDYNISEALLKGLKLIDVEKKFSIKKVLVPPPPDPDKF